MPHAPELVRGRGIGEGVGHSRVRGGGPVRDRVVRQPVQSPYRSPPGARLLFLRIYRRGILPVEYDIQ
jgi:hypothetical protein